MNLFQHLFCYPIIIHFIDFEDQKNEPQGNEIMRLKAQS